MEKICLDYEAALDFLKGEPVTIEKLKYYADREEICITSFTMVHLMESIKKTEAVGAFINSVNVLSFDRKAAAVAARLMREVRELGIRDAQMDDVLTAAMCISNNAFLFARKPSKFDGIKGLRKV